MQQAKPLKNFLDKRLKMYETPAFIEEDPISIPHGFQKKQDIEIIGFWAAVLAWGQRKTIINKCRELLDMMGNAPHDFVLNHSEEALRPFEDFKHRTFNGTDALYFISFFRDYYQNHESLEEIFSASVKRNDLTVENGLKALHERFFSLPYAPDRTRKHVATPARKSACKRLNMFLRWMVRPSDKGVDFGIWEQIKRNQLVCPLDVHVDRVARKVGLLKRKQNDWAAALELTNELRQLRPRDPVAYDFALFGLSAYENAEVPAKLMHSNSE